MNIPLSKQAKEKPFTEPMRLPNSTKPTPFGIPLACLFLSKQVTLLLSKQISFDQGTIRTYVILA